MKLNRIINRIDPLLQRQVDLFPELCVDFCIQHTDVFDPTTVGGLTVNSKGSSVTTASGNLTTIENLKTAPGVLKVSASTIMKMHR